MGHEDPHQKGIWESTVTIVGIAFCVIIIIATVAFVCHNRRMKKQKQQKRAQAHQALLSNGEIPNSPTHSIHSLQGSANISFHDPTGSPTKRNYVKTKNLSGSAQKVQRQKQSMSPAAGRGGREVASRRSSQNSSNSHRKGSAGTPGSMYQSSIPSPYAVSSEPRDYEHDPSMFRVSPIPPDEAQSRSHRHARRHSPHSPPVSPTRGKPSSHGSRSPTKSMGSMRSGSPSSLHSPTDSRNRSYRDAIGKKSNAAPLADVEDMSPTSHSSPTHKMYGAPQKNKMASIRENIPMDSYRDTSKKGRHSRIDETPLEQRPPVEGRDSLTRKKQPQDPDIKNRGSNIKTGPTTPDYQNTNMETRPHIKPLPLRDVQRPDGQSPENKPVDPNVNTPISQVSDLSPFLQKTTLFGDQTNSQTPSEVVFMGDQEFEYDDYMPDLPGSYFTMDPHAYTLTWSQQAPWAQKPGVSQAGSMASIRTTDTQGMIDRNNSKC